MIHGLSYRPEERAALCFYSGWPDAFDDLTFATAAMDEQASALPLMLALVRTPTWVDGIAAMGCTSRCRPQPWSASSAAPCC